MSCDLAGTGRAGDSMTVRRPGVRGSGNDGSASSQMRTLTNAERALDLRKHGYTYREIGKIIGLSHEGARLAVQGAVRYREEHFGDRVHVGPPRC
jgi:hypothetical protein